MSADTVWLELRDCFLPEGLVARDATLPGLVLDGCLLEHPVKPPLAAERLRAAADVFLSDAVVAAAVEDGAVCLPGAHIGQLDCSGTKTRNESGPAVRVDSLQVDHDVLLRHGFDAVGAGERGAVCLIGAHICGELECAGAKIRNESGPALNAAGLQVDQTAFLWKGFEAVGAGERGTVRLRGARIGGRLDCSGAKVSNESGPALLADSLEVDQDVFLREGFEAVGAGERGTVRLTGMHLGGLLEFSADGVENRSHPQARLQVDGLTYTGVPVGLSVDEWLRLLREGTPAYAAQPYQQLAAAHRAAGHDRQVRKILIEQRRHQIRSGALTGQAARAWARLTGLSLGYGYQPWRALIGLLAVLIVAVALCVSIDGALAHTKNSSTPGAPCATVEQIGVGLDLGVPLIKSGTRTQCDLTDQPAGQWLTVSGWALQLLAWAFATLFIAGFTCAVRKT